MTVSTMPMQNASEQAAALAAQARGAAEAAREQAAAARDIAREQRSVAEELRQAARDAAQVGTEGQGGKITITLPDGREINVDGAVPGELAQVLGMPPQLPPEESDAPYVVGAIAIVATAVVLIAGFTLLYRAKMRGLVNRGEVSPELSQRMARMETAIESVAVEVERISEGQRFTTRLLSDRAPMEVPRG